MEITWIRGIELDQSGIKETVSHRRAIPATLPPCIPSTALALLQAIYMSGMSGKRLALPTTPYTYL